jgi:hypothetical protein
MSIESDHSPESPWLPDVQPPTSDIIGAIETRTADLLPFVENVSYKRSGQLAYERSDQQSTGIPVDVAMESVDGITVRRMAFKIPFPTTTRVTRRGMVTLVDTSSPRAKSGWSIHFTDCGNNPAHFLGLLSQGVNTADEGIRQLGVLAGLMPGIAPNRAVDQYGYTVGKPEFFSDVWASTNNDLNRQGVPTRYLYDHTFPCNDGDIRVAANELADSGRLVHDNPPDTSIVIAQKGAFKFTRGARAGLSMSCFEEQQNTNNAVPLTDADRSVHPYKVEKCGEDAHGTVYNILKWNGDEWKSVHSHEGTPEEAQTIADGQYQHDLYVQSRSGHLTQDRAQRVLNVLNRAFNTEMQRMLLATD